MARVVVSFEEFEKWAKDKNFNDIDIDKINKRRLHYHMSYHTIMTRYDDAKEELEKIGFSSRNAMIIIILNPMLVYAKDQYKERFDVFKKYVTNDGKTINMTGISSLLKYQKEKTSDVIKTLKKHRISDDDIKKILSKNHRFFTAPPSLIDEHLTYIENLGIPTKKIIEALKQHAGGIFKVNDDFVEKRVSKLTSYGFENIMDMFKQNLNILTMPDNKLDDVIDYWIKLLGKEKTIEVLNKKPYHFNINFNFVKKIKKSLKSYTFNENEINIILIKAVESITKCYDTVSKLTKTLENMGFNQKEVKQIILDDPKLLYKSMDSLKKSYNIILDCNFSEDETKTIILNYPRLLESCPESIKEKLDLINKLDIKDIILLNPKNLIQGNEKTYLRYMYAFNVLEEEIETKNYTLIYSSKLKKMPDIEELRTMYSYEDDMNNLLDNRLKKAKENNIKVKCLH